MLLNARESSVDNGTAILIFLVVVLIIVLVVVLGGRRTTYVEHTRGSFTLPRRFDWRTMRDRPMAAPEPWAASKWLHAQCGSSLLIGGGLSETSPTMPHMRPQCTTSIRRVTTVATSTTGTTVTRGIGRMQDTAGSER